MNTILKVLVGSRAHGLAGPESDEDYRGVFVHPTSVILDPFAQKPKQTSWIEGAHVGEEAKTDDTAWEIGHFLSLASHCNPTILEVFCAPVVEATADGIALRQLFDSLWMPSRVRDAFVGYGLNQRKKFLDNKDMRREKYAVAYLRVLYQAFRLLTDGHLPVVMTDTEVYERLRAWRTGDFTIGEVIQVTHLWQAKVEAASEKCLHRQDLSVASAFILDLRRRHWA